LNFPPLGIAGLQPFDVIDEGVDDTWPGLWGVFHQHVLFPLHLHLLTTYNWFRDAIRSLALSLDNLRQVDLRQASTNMAGNVSLFVEDVLWHVRMGILAAFNWFQNMVRTGWESLTNLLDNFKNRLLSVWRMIRRSRFVAASLLLLFIGGGIGSVIYALHHPHV
jgi:hypothetical protein